MRLTGKLLCLNLKKKLFKFEKNIFILVLVSDLLVFYPSTIMLKDLFTPKSAGSTTSSVSTLLLILLNPTIALIDHGHFQYNCVSLGLMQLAVYFFIKNTKQQFKNYLIGSVMFCLALNYKQMELYHSLPIFFFLLSKCCCSKLNGISTWLVK